MANILDEIAERTRERIEKEKLREPLTAVRARAEEALRRNVAAGRAGESCSAGAGAASGRAEESCPAGVNSAPGIVAEDHAAAEGLLPFERALAKPGISFICEVKKASPSKGLIAPDFPYLSIAKEYEQAGASAISCLTEPYYFQGQDAFLREIAAEVSIPVLRKDFTVDEYMIYQARALGAGAVLLICALLDDAQLAAFAQLARELKLAALVEAHTEEEVERALRAGARIIGVNNRDLKTFRVDINTSARLRRLVPPEILFVSESGIRGAQDIQKLRENGTDAVLIGETLMRAPDKKALLKEWGAGKTGHL